MRKWLVEETGEVRRAKRGEASVDEGGFQSWTFDTDGEYHIVKITEIPDLKVGDWIKLPEWYKFYEISNIDILRNKVTVKVPASENIIADPECAYALTGYTWLKHDDSSRKDNPVSFDEWNW